MRTKVLICVIAVAVTVIAQEAKVRVFVTDSQSWEIKGTAGGARPQSAEVIKTVGDRCPNLTVTSNKEKADYVLTLDHEGGKKVAQKDNKWALYNKDGDVIKSGSTRALGNSVKDACEAITKDREKKP